MEETSMEEVSRKERGVKRRKRWVVFYVLLAIFVMLAVAAWVCIWYLQPQRHFQNVPVAVQPKGNGTTPAQPGTSTPSTSPSAQPAPQKPATAPASFNVLILGIDARSGEEASRSDVIMVAHVVPADKTVNLVSIPRDTRVNLPGIGLTKITHAHFVGNLGGGNHGGTEAAMAAVSDFLHIQINYYAKMNFQGFQQFVDSIGGVDVTFPRAVGPFPAGPNHLNGEQTLEAARERYSLPNSDFGRQFDQSLVLRSIVHHLLSAGNIPHLPDEIKQLQSDVLDTNFTSTDLLSFALLCKDMDISQIHYDQIPGHDGVAMDPLVGLNLDYWIPDDAAVQKIAHDELGASN